MSFSFYVDTLKESCLGMFEAPTSNRSKNGEKSSQVLGALGAIPTVGFCLFK